LVSIAAFATTCHPLPKAEAKPTTNVTSKGTRKGKDLEYEDEGCCYARKKF
jgi:hypothetical protein